MTRILIAFCALLAALTLHCAVAAAPAAVTMSTADVGRLFDAVMPERLRRRHIAGAVVAVVKDGQVLFTKGYGDASVADKRAVSVEQTLFRLGGPAPLLTWIAVMQQVEQGKLSLDADINTYLDFHIPEAYGKPITMRHLMTHTSGFEEINQGARAADAAHLGTLHDYLAEHIPSRIFAPGSVPARSDYATSLAGYIVTRTSGEEFAAYVQRHITTPLGLHHATFAQPLPAALAPLMSASYDDVAHGARPFEWLRTVPQNALSASAADMAQLMLLFLDGGTLHGARILAPASVAAMQTAQRSFDARDNAMGLGHLLLNQNGQRVLEFIGETAYSYSSLDMIPERGVGVFVAYNSAGGAIDIYQPFFGKFMDRYYPYTAPVRPTLASAPEDAKKVAGYYMKSRRGETNMYYLGAILGQSEMTAGPDGTLLRNGRQAFRETGPGFWEDVKHPQDHLIFHLGEDGGTQFSYGNPENIGTDAAWYQRRPFLLTLLSVVLAGCLLSLLSWPVLGIWRRLRRRTAHDETGASHASIVVRLVPAIHLLFWVTFLGLLTSATPELLAAPWFDALVKVIQLVCWLGAAGLLALLWATCAGWAAPGWTRAHRVLLCFVCLASVWLAWYVNLLALHVRY